MAGICGIVNLNGSPLKPDQLNPMIAAVPHRATQGFQLIINKYYQFAGFETKNSAYDFHLDPLEKDSLVTVCDARLDNSDYLSNNLETHKDATDNAGLLLHAYLKWGIGSPAELLGDFSFVIWDARDHRLLAARDIMGMRPLYYYFDDECCIFASEIKQILALKYIDEKIDACMLAAYLSGRFDPLDRTLYRNIRSLPPGHCLIIEDRSPRVQRFRDFSMPKRLSYCHESEYWEHFQEIFAQAVRCRVTDQQKVGFMLSGGIDSGSMTAMAAFLKQKGLLSADIILKAYCWAFDRVPQCDERHISRHLIDDYQLPYADIPVTGAWPLCDYPSYGPDRDDPFIGVYQPLIEKTLQRAQYDGMQVVLSADRGDLLNGTWIINYTELLRMHRWADLWQAANIQRHALNQHLWQIFYREIFVGLIKKLSLQNISRFVKKPLPSKTDQGTDNLPPWLTDKTKNILQAYSRDHKNDDHLNALDYYRRKRFRTITEPMHFRGMIWSNRTNARYGLGFADPWSDLRLIEYILSIPQQIINRPGEIDKRFVRESLRDVIPHNFRQQARKIVPSPLYHAALTQWERDTVWDLINHSVAAEFGVIDKEKLTRHYCGILDGQPQHATFWWTLTTEMWLRQYWS